MIAYVPFSEKTVALLRKNLHTDRPAQVRKKYFMDTPF